MSIYFYASPVLLPLLIRHVEVHILVYIPVNILVQVVVSDPQVCDESFRVLVNSQNNEVPCHDNRLDKCLYEEYQPFLLKRKKSQVPTP